MLPTISPLSVSPSHPFTITSITPHTIPLSHFDPQATLNSGLDLREAVKLPSDEELHDWLAVHVVDFFNRVNIIYGTVCEYCTDDTCPIMSGGPKFEYYWADETQKKPQALPASQVGSSREDIV